MCGRIYIFRLRHTLDDVVKSLNPQVRIYMGHRLIFVGLLKYNILTNGAGEKSRSNKSIIFPIKRFDYSGLFERDFINTHIKQERCRPVVKLLKTQTPEIYVRGPSLIS